MNRIAKITLILVLTMSSIVIIQTTASEVSKPAVPEFNVKFVDYSYDIPPSYTTNPYNGQREITYYGDHIYNKTLEVTINNQPFTPSGDINLYYNFRYKGVYEQNWHEAFGVPCDGMTPEGGNFRIENYGASTTFIRYTLPWDTPSTGKIDVQVQAMIGTPIVSSNCRIIFSEYSYGFNGIVSGWSNTKTVSLSSGEVTVSQSTITPTPIQPTPSIYPTTKPTTNPTANQPNAQSDISLEIAWKDIVIVVAIAVDAALAVALVLTRRKKQ